MKRLILFLVVLGSLVWVYNLQSGMRTAASLSDAGVTQFSMVVLPFAMPLVGLSLSALFTPWLLKIGKPSIALALVGFSLLAGAIVAWVAGAAAAG